MTLELAMSWFGRPDTLYRTLVRSRGELLELAWSGSLDGCTGWWWMIARVDSTTPLTGGWSSSARARDQDLRQGHERIAARRSESKESS